MCPVALRTDGDVNDDDDDDDDDLQLASHYMVLRHRQVKGSGPLCY